MAKQLPPPPAPAPPMAEKYVLMTAAELDDRLERASLRALERFQRRTRSLSTKELLAELGYGRSTWMRILRREPELRAMALRRPGTQPRWPFWQVLLFLQNRGYGAQG